MTYGLRYIDDINEMWMRYIDYIWKRYIDDIWMRIYR